MPDTNVLLHTLPLDQIPWPALVGSKVELVLVAQVLSELDKKKYGDSDKLKRRARRVTSEIGAWIPPGTTTNQISDGVKLRVVAREPAMFSGLDPTVGDDRVIASALELAKGGTRVLIATSDISMRIKAEAHGLQVIAVPDAYCIKEDEARKAPKAPKLVAGFHVEGADNLSDNLSVKLGLSAAHLMSEALERLADARIRTEAQKTPSRSDSLSVRRIERKPDVEAYERHVLAIQNFDAENANIAHLVLAISNDGGSPADDIWAEFRFPNAVELMEHQPRYPIDPADRFDIRSAFRSDARPSDGNDSVRIGHTREGAPNIAIKIKRLMHQLRFLCPIWVRVPDEHFDGFPVEATMLVASPPLTLDSRLNIRVERTRLARVLRQMNEAAD